MNKHTDGPWEVLPEEADVPYLRVRGTMLGRRYKIANVLVYPNPRVGSEETLANARLIAAAPDLLAACRGLLDALPSATTHPAIRAARAALAKAGAE